MSSFGAEMLAVAQEIIASFVGTTANLVFIQSTPNVSSEPWKGGGAAARVSINGVGVIVPSSSLDESERATLLKETTAVCYTADASVLANSELRYIAITSGDEEYRVLRAISYRISPDQPSPLYVFEMTR